MMPDDLRDESFEQQQLIKHVQHFHVQGGPSALQPCCIKPENLTREHQLPQWKGMSIRVCRHCGRRHIRMQAEPGVIGVTGTPLGAANVTDPPR